MMKKSTFGAVLAFLFANHFNIVGLGRDFSKNLGVPYNVVLFLGLTIAAMITASVASQLISSRDHGPGSRWNTETGSFLFLRMVAISSFSPLFVQYPALCPQRTKARASARPHTPSAHSQ